MAFRPVRTDLQEALRIKLHYPSPSRPPFEQRIPGSDLAVADLVGAGNNDLQRLVCVQIDCQIAEPGRTPAFVPRLLARTGLEEQDRTCNETMKTPTLFTTSYSLKK
jgi:hypothetical protein